MWGSQELAVVQEQRYLGALLSADCTHTTHFDKVIQQGNARVTAMRGLLSDPYLTVKVKCMLMTSALRPVLEYACEVLEPSASQVKALESVQLKAARCILGCPTLSPSEAVRNDLGLSLLSSRRHLVKLKWQYRVRALPSDRLERVVYDRTQPAPGGGVVRRHKLLSHICAQIWSSLPAMSSSDALCLPYPRFVSGLTKAITERDAVAFTSALSSKPWLGLYNRVNEGAGLKEYLQRHEEGHKGAQIRFQLRVGQASLQALRSRLHHEDEEDREGDSLPVCPNCRGADETEDVQHVLFLCPAYSTIREQYISDLRRLVDSQAFTSFMSLDTSQRAVAFLRDDFMASCQSAQQDVGVLSDKFLVNIMAHRQHAIDAHDD